MPDRIRLDGRIAVVTGAAGVIGRATMGLLAERGAKIVAVDRKLAELEAAIKELPASAQAMAVMKLFTMRSRPSSTNPPRPLNPPRPRRPPRSR